MYLALLDELTFLLFFYSHRRFILQASAYILVNLFQLSLFQSAFPFSKSPLYQLSFSSHFPAKAVWVWFLWQFLYWMLLFMFLSITRPWSLRGQRARLIHLSGLVRAWHIILDTCKAPTNIPLSSPLHFPSLGQRSLYRFQLPPADSLLLPALDFSGKLGTGKGIWWGRSWLP